MGFLFYGEKPNYKKQIISKFLGDKFKLSFKEYDDLTIKEIKTWLSKIENKEKELHGELSISVSVHESSSGGCGTGPVVIEMRPYFKRFETSAEYRERIEDEERQYNERLEKEKKAEYDKDMGELERIKKKYNL